MLYDPRTRSAREGDDALLETFGDGGTILWIDLYGEEEQQEQQLLEETFGIHAMAVQDAQRERHPPKYEAFDDYYFLLLKGLSVEATDIDFDTIQIALFVGENYIITRHAEKSLSIDTLWRSTLDHPEILQKGVKSLAPRLGRLVVNRYLALLFQIESSLDQLEQEMLHTDPTDQQLKTLSIYKTRLRKMSRTFTYHEQMFAELRVDPRVTDDGELQHEFTDTYEQLERVESLARLYYDLASDLIQSSISLASHRLNGIMKVLTIITAIFVPLGFVAGLYGMNFDYMPELQFRGAYFLVLGAMAGIVVMLLGLFRYKRWL
jgi:magnesium transporter